MLAVPSEARKTNSKFNILTTIIIPAFNAEKYISAAIGSVISQSVADWELLIVNDGSSDSTGRICDNASESDKRIRVIHTPNRGVSAARNTALDLVSGKYIVFLDADDILDPDFLKICLDVIEDSKADMVAVPFSKFYDKDFNPRRHESSRLPSSKPPVSLLGSETALRHLLYQTPVSHTGYYFDTSVWGKLYRAELWRDLRFREGIRFEDLDIFYRLISYKCRVAFVQVPLLYYRIHSGSFLQNYTPSRLDALDVTDSILDFFEGSGLEKAARTRRFAAHYNIFLLQRKYRIKDASTLSRCKNVIRSERLMIIRNKDARFKDRTGALISFLLF